MSKPLQVFFPRALDSVMKDDFHFEDLKELRHEDFRGSLIQTYP